MGTRIAFISHVVRWRLSGATDWRTDAPPVTHGTLPDLSRRARIPCFSWLFGSLFEWKGLWEFFIGCSTLKAFQLEQLLERESGLTLWFSVSVLLLECVGTR